MRLVLALAAALCLGLVVRPAAARAPAHKKHAPAFPMGRSVGAPNQGHLVGGSHLESATYLRIVPADRAGDVRWGLGSLVSMIDRAARRVRHQFKGAVLSVGQISQRGGGDIQRHASHESGRDADIAFYVHNGHGREIFADHFVRFRGDGTAPTWPGARFDDAKNWALVAALLDDPVAHVSHIFVSTPLRARLLSYAKHAGAPAALVQRAADTMEQPRGTLPHDDHFHVRISCPSGMRGCVENPVLSWAARHKRHKKAAHHAHPARHDKAAHRGKPASARERKR